MRSLSEFSACRAGGLGFCLLAVLLAAATVGARSLTTTDDGRWHPLVADETRAAPELEFPAEPSLDMLTARVRVFGFDIESVVHEDVYYDRLTIPDEPRLGVPGLPEIPVLRKMVAIPDCVAYELVVTTSGETFMDGMTVSPAPDHRIRREGSLEYVEEVFTLDASFYAIDATYPETRAEVVDEGWMRDQRFVILELHPIQYNPARGTLSCVSSIDVELVFDAPTVTNTRGLGPMEPIAVAVLHNYQGVGTWSSPATRSSRADTVWEWCSSVAACESLGTDYLMIVEDGLLNAGGTCRPAEELAEKKAWYDGFNVALVKTSDIAASIDPYEIKAFIDSLYQTASAENVIDGHLGYVLLIGDAIEPDAGDTTQSTQLLPAFEYDYDDTIVTTDHWYACLSGDDLAPDLGLGRLAVGDTIELETETSKIIAYEPAPTGQAWRDSIYLSCGFSDEDPSSISATHVQMEKITSLIPSDYSITEMHIHDFPSQQYANGKTANLAAVKAGKLVVEQFGHGWPCGSMAFTADEADVLENTDMLPFWLNMSCGTGDYANVTVTDCGIDEDTDCLGEHLMHYDSSGETGTIGFFGASEPTHAKSLPTQVIDGLFHNQCPMIGQAAAFGKTKLLATSTSFFELLQIVQYNLLGDPALDLFLEDAEGYVGAPDLVIHQDDFSVADVSSHGDDVEFECDVSNRSGVSTPGDTAVVVLFDVYRSDGSHSASLYDTLGQMGAWTSAVAQATMPTTSDSLGGYYVWVHVDPDSAIAELREVNNTVPDSLKFQVAPYAAGFPVAVDTTSGCVYVSEPIACDLNGDGDIEVVFTGMRSPIHGDPFTRVHLVDSAGSMHCLADLEYTSGGALSPAIGDLDAEHALLEIVMVTADSLFVIDVEYDAGWDGTVLARAELQLAYSSPALVDIYPVDGRPEAVFPEPVSTNSGRLSVWDVDPDGPTLAWTASLGTGIFTGPVSPVTVVNSGLSPADLVIWGADFSPAKAYCIAADSTIVWSEEVYTDSSAITHYGKGMAAADLDDDGDIEVVGLPRGDVAYIHVFDSADGDIVWTSDDSFDYGTVAVGNIDSDADLEIVAMATLNSGELWVSVFDDDSAGEATWSLELSGAATWCGEPIIGDFDGGTDIEVIVGTTASSVTPGWLYILKIPATGDTLVPLIEPFELPGAYRGGVLCDIDGDGANDFVFLTADGQVHRFEYWGTSTPRFEWPMYRHNPQHTGLYQQPVSGSLTESASWSGDMLVRGDVTVTDGDTLWIAPGTDITVVSDSDGQSAGEDSTLCELTVEGRLHAVGGSAHPVAFFCEDGGAADWYGVILDSASVCTLGYVEMTDAEKSLWATNPTSMNVHHCTFENHGVGKTGVRLEWCGSSVSLVDCTIEDCSTGVRIANSNVTISGNTVDVSATTGNAYGLRVTNDHGTFVRGNILSAESVGGVSYGLHIDNADSALQVCLNDVWIGDWHGVGMYFEDINNASTRIDSNDLTGTYNKTSGGNSKGMQFKNSGSTVRWNEIYNFNKASFYISTGGAPDFGDTTTTDGNNATDTKADYYIYATKKSTPVFPIKAENNWWGTASPSGAKFYGSNYTIDYQPYLDSDPNGRRERRHDDGVVVHRYFLCQNKPNPFNPVTTIGYGLAADGRALMRIYDVAGRLVRTLVDQTLPAGSYAAVWDGTNERGGKVATGVYFCRFETEAYTESRKMVLLK